MTVGREGVGRGSRGPFGLWTSTKVVEGSEQPIGTSMASNSSAVDSIALRQARKDKISSRLRRNSSRLLTLFRGRRESSNGETCLQAELSLVYTC